MEEYVKDYILQNEKFTTEGFSGMLRQYNPDIGRSTIYKRLKSLCDDGQIMRISRGHFTSHIKSDYSYEMSKEMRSVTGRIQGEYPLVDYQVWELFQLNEFVNHQISRNTLFVEVEAKLDESIFNLFFEKYPHVLLNPSADEYYRYMGERTIVVRKLLSEVPTPNAYKQACIEKILVDLFEHGLSGSLIERTEYPDILQTAFAGYNINQPRLFRYARRRGLEKVIMEYIAKNTDIRLEIRNDR